ncbi:MAG: EF-hand domain-containing protein [Methylotenera sp.]|nr:EF-hand domain-containing protein [Methylotenera sp.]
MKILQLIIMAALALGLTQMAYADNHSKDGMHCDRKHTMQDADANKDGALSREEFSAYHQKMSDEMFTKMDANKDGKIDQDERYGMKSKMGKKCKMKDHKIDDATK